MKTNLSVRRYLTVLLSAFLFFFLHAVFFSAVNAEEGEETVPDNGIPVVYVNIDESQGTIEDMLQSPDHSAYCYGTVSIEVPEGFHYSDFEDLACESVENLVMSIRGRGNSTWQRADKKPFKIKLDKKTDIFGLGKNKHWVLVANALDPTLLRDRITAWLGDQMNFEFTPRGVPVDLVMTGENYGTQYLGSYYLSENVRVDTNRLEIDELSEEDVEEPAITGGYLLQDALQVRQGSPDRFYTKRGVDWATNTPSFDTEEENAANLSEGLGGALLEESFAIPQLEDAYKNDVQQTYIQNHIQKVEDSFYTDDLGYRDLIDVESAAKYWLMNSFSLNSDAFVTGSTYIYKKRDVDGVIGKIFWGPLWDFDFAWDNKDVTSGFSVGHAWMRPMFTDRGEGGFVQEVKKQWDVLRPAGEALIAEGGIIDQYYEETKASAAWDYAINHADQYDYEYITAVEQLKTWIRNRIDWIDANLELLDDLAYRVRFESDGEFFTVDFIESGKTIELIEDYVPEKEGYVFLGWLDENGEAVDIHTPIYSDMTLTANFVSEEEAVQAQDIAMRKENDIIAASFWSKMYQIDYCVVPADAQDAAVEWTSSDESFATIDSQGMITYEGTGTAVFTAKLKNGKTRTFTLTVVSGELPVPEAVYPETETVHMNIGDQLPLYVKTEPSPAKIHTWYYESADESVAEVDSYGIVTAAGPGETVIHITAVNGFDDDGTVFDVYVTVIVSEEMPEPEPDPEPTPAVISYTVASGDNSVYTKGSKSTLKITVKRSEADETCFAHFTNVRIDGKLIARDKDYTAVSGSTVISLKPSLLETLKTGSHTLTIEFDDGKSETSVIVKAAPVPESPDTSDHRDHSWYAVLGASLLVFIMALRLRMKHS